MATIDPFYNSEEDSDYQIEEEEEDDDDDFDEEDYELDINPSELVSHTRENLVFEALMEEENADEEDVVEVCGPGGGAIRGSSGGVEMADVFDPASSSSAVCPVCYEPWTSEGPHRVCCILCGHVYGRSCLEKWVERCGSYKAKCPQCSRQFRKKDIINLFAPVIGVQHQNLYKELCALREKNELLISEKKACLQHAKSGSAQKRLFDYFSHQCDLPAQFFSEHNILPHNPGGSDNFQFSFALKNEWIVDGARVLGIDAASEIVFVSGKKTSFGGEHLLSKISVLAPSEIDKIQLPPNTGAVRDLCILPSSLALIASLGKKLSLFSTRSNQVVLKYDLPVPVWSCSHDANDPNYIYAGLQNGMVFVFDLRQTERCVASLEGLSGHPIHTIHSIVHNDNTRKVVTASALGPCIWNVGGIGECPSLIPGMENQGICISLACSSSTDELVASYRPKVEVSNDTASCSQTSSSPSQPISGCGKVGTHVLIKRLNSTQYFRHRNGFGYVSELRMQKSAIISSECSNPLFVYADESTRGVCLSELPSFQVVNRLMPHPTHILDLRYAKASGPGFLGTISEDKLQLFTCSNV
ncbi:E3 ubiquitin-protein ligase RFWD3 protein [Dioscorea alata]|uniref:E3 ubiquitin-protein ligase RFWD3 protein n=1 Tax=Dioscorea alata TaxID=55571 RepID=A0ACB7UQV9_DIOAL|nr:E3 ubiquitin-protein ligase RFWD3 protein [Dioscorea alata]